MMRKKMFYLKAAGFTVTLLIFLNLANYYLYNDNTYTRVMMHEMYQAESVDLVFSGTSTTYRHYNPQIWDEHLGVKSFNTGSSNQWPDISYFLLKELFKNHHPDYCIYTLSSTMFLEIEDRNNPLPYYLLFDNYNLNLNKLICSVCQFGDKSLLEAWIPFTRNANEDLAGQFCQNSKIKSMENYKLFGTDIYESDTETYRGRGFVYTNRQTPAGEVGNLNCYNFSDYNIHNSDITYMKKIVSLCESNRCKVIFAVTPLPYAEMRLYDDYQEVIDFYRQLAAECEVPLFDFTLVKPKLFALTDDMFYDFAHMSGKGADCYSTAASELIGGYIRGEDIDMNEYFYSSYEELLDAAPRVYSTWMERDTGGYKAYSTYGNNVTPVYSFYASADAGETWDLIRGYSTDCRIAFSDINEKYDMLMVQAKSGQEKDGYQQLYRMEVK